MKMVRSISPTMGCAVMSTIATMATDSIRIA